ncbi:hypothetical protein ACSBR2_021928 [Camellia fascicularis]
MLDSNFNAKIGDFGLARLVNHDKASQTTVLAGTMGYMTPECLGTYKASKESDIYSFGVVALEIARGRKSTDFKVPERQMILVEWVWELYGTDRFLEATVDLKMCPDFVQEEIECLIIVERWCAHPNHNLRPSISFGLLRLLHAWDDTQLCDSGNFDDGSVKESCSFIALNNILLL